MIELENPLKAILKPIYFRLCLALLLWLTVNNLIWGQTQSTPNGNFEVEEVIGCAPFTVAPNNLLTGGGSIQYNYDNTLDPSTCSTNYQADPFSCTNGNYTGDNSYVYSTPGTYYLIQLNGNAPDGNKVSFVKITVIEPVAPVFNLYSCGNSNVFVDLDFAQDDYTGYEIDFGDGTTQTIEKSTDSNILEHQYAIQGVYEINVSGKTSSGICSTSTGNVATLGIPPTPVFNRLEVIGQDNILIDYELLDNRFSYRAIIRSQDLSQIDTFDIDPNANPNQLDYVNPAFNFSDTIYSVFLENYDRCDETLVKPSESAYTITAEGQAGYIGSQIEVNFNYETDGGANFSEIRLYENGGLLDSSNNNIGTFQSTVGNCNDLGIYLFEATFGAITSVSVPILPSEENTFTPPPVLSMEGELENSTFKLQFDPAPVTTDLYTVYREINGSFQPIGTSENTEFSDTNLRSGELEICYAVSYEDECGNQSELSQGFCFELSIGTLNLPNAFTPNGDGFNDTFTAGGGIFNSFQMSIFNRWGTLVFNTADPAIGWDGQINGSPAPVGGYVYHVSFRDSANTSIQQSGTFILIR